MNRRLRLAWVRLALAALWMAPGRPRLARHRWIAHLMTHPTPPEDPNAAGFNSAGSSLPTTEPGDAHGPPPRTVTLYLVRHGQTQYNVEHRLPGQLPGISLTEEGRRQAAELGKALADMPLTAVISSPLERARETAEILLGARDVSLTLDPRLMDTNVGRWAGAKIDDLAKSDPEWKQFAHRPTAPPEGIEGFYHVLQRVVAVAEEARHAEALGEFIMLVAHADVVKLLISHYLRLPIEGAGWLHIPNASITALEFVGDSGPSALALSWLPSPAWLRPAPPPTPSAAPEG